MRRTKIAIACQGGGSQTAFTAGALKALCQSDIRNEFELVGITGTSGGAICASLVWFAFENGDAVVWQRLIDFWHDNAAQGMTEQWLNQMTINTIRMTHGGLLPAFHVSPASPMVEAMMSMATMGQRENFRNFRALLETHIDFDKIAAWGPRREAPVLIIGAVNVLSGKLAKFVSSKEPIKVDHILASCAIPNLFPAVPIGEDAYWDGLFSDNPPIKELIRPASVGDENLPDEIWLIKINPTTRASAPQSSADILDRRNQLEGNISLFQQLRHLEMLNDMLLMDAFQPAFLAQFDIKKPVRLPKSFATDPDRPYHIPCIEMSADLQESLDYASKIDRSRAHIDRLMAEGERAAQAFLAERARTVAD
jgi:NTE family protein